MTRHTIESQELSDGRRAELMKYTGEHSGRKQYGVIVLSANDHDPPDIHNDLTKKEAEILYTNVLKNDILDK